MYAIVLLHLFCVYSRGISVYLEQEEVAANYHHHKNNQSQKHVESDYTFFGWFRSWPRLTINKYGVGQHDAGKTLTQIFGPFYADESYLLTFPM